MSLGRHVPGAAQSRSRRQPAEEQSQHKMPKAKYVWPVVFDFISTKGLFPPSPSTGEGPHPGAECCFLRRIPLRVQIIHAGFFQGRLGGD